MPAGTSGDGCLLLDGSGLADPLRLLLPASATAAGLSVTSRLDRLTGRRWCLVWGPGDAPPGGVLFDSGDLRFRREQHRPAHAVGRAWLAVAVGGFCHATVDPDGPAPLRLVLAQQR